MRIVLFLLAMLMFMSSAKAENILSFLQSMPPTEEIQYNVSQYQRIINKTGLYVVVNIPSYELIVYNSGVELFRSKAIVGSKHSKTPIFDTNIIGVKFYPDWTPTPSMIEAEKQKTGKTLHRKRPGKSNPLGLIKFELDNGKNIYIHDTDKRQYFNKSERALSHGCIRIQRFIELASTVLQWDKQTVEDEIETKHTHIIPVTEIPVSIIYMTYWNDENGIIQHHPDVYHKF